MVFRTFPLFVRSKGPDEVWRKRRIFKLSAHFHGRSRNCYSIAVRAVHRALVYATKARALKKQDTRALWDARLAAACEEHNFSYPLMRESLSRCNILLNRKVLTDLAIWEPRSFKNHSGRRPLTLGIRIRITMDTLEEVCSFLNDFLTKNPENVKEIYIFCGSAQNHMSLVKLAWSRASEDGLNGVKELGEEPSGVITRGMIK